MKSPSYSAEQLAEAAWATVLSEPMVAEDAIPKGFKTTDQLAKEYNLHVRTIRDRLKAAGNKIEMQQFRIKTGNTTRLTPHYRVK